MERLDLSTVIAPILSRFKVLTAIEVLKQKLMVRKTLSTAKQRAFPSLLSGHLGADISFNRGPDNESMQGTFIRRSVTRPTRFWSVPVHEGTQELLVRNRSM